MCTKNILHIVGYKNSGKTTLIANWVTFLKDLDYQVAVIKHHGHGAKLAMPDERKDSMQYLQAGADTSIVSGGGYTQHISQSEKNYHELLELAKKDEPDLILVEGYKQVAAGKVILINQEDDWQSLKTLKGIQLVVGLEQKTSYPQIDSRTNNQALNDWLYQWLKENGVQVK